MIPIIRAAQAADADRVAEIHGRAGQWAYGDLLPAAFLAGLSVERRAAYWRRWLSDSGLRRHLWLSTREAHVVGFAATSPSRDTDADTKTGELERWAGMSTAARRRRSLVTAPLAKCAIERPSRPDRKGE